MKASLIAQLVKNLPAMQEILVRFPGQEDPLEKEMATHSSILAWEIPRTEEPGRLRSIKWQRLGHDWATDTHAHNVQHQECTKVNHRVITASQCRFISLTKVIA